MSYDNLGSVSQNGLKFYQQLTGEERRMSLLVVTSNQNASNKKNKSLKYIP
jgi:hypothetical protein